MNYAHLPNWLANNPIYQFVFLLRKLFLIKASFRHYSQFGEDIAVAQRLAGIENGFFVDVGSFHPRKYNNTYLLYKKGWRGVNIDLDPVKIRGFRLFRPGDTSICCAISDHPPANKKATVYSFGFYTLIQTLSKERAEEFARAEGHSPREQVVPCRTLQDVLDSTPYRNRVIDYLTVDCEGHDLQVLKSMPWEIYRPRVVTLECDGDYDRVMNSELARFMQSMNYELFAWTPPSLHFAKR